MDCSVYLRNIWTHWIREKCIYPAFAKTCQIRDKPASAANFVLLWSISRDIFCNDGIEFNEGVPSISEFDPGKGSCLLILDDLMHETNDVVTKLFTRLSHHTNTSVIFITQNIFGGGKETRTITLNAQYMVLFKNVRDKSQIAYLAKQIYPSNWKHMVEAYEDATTTTPYSYLFLDLKPNADDKHRPKACIFPDDKNNYVYVPK